MIEESVLDEFRALNDPERRREIERHGGFFIVEGLLALRALVDSRYPIRAVLSAENRAAMVLEFVGRRAPIYVLPQEEVAAITGFNFHRGVLASAERVPPLPVSEVVQDARTLAVVEGVNDHENLGALFRNAAAFGIDAVLLDPTSPDPLYRRSVRVSMGHVLRVPFARCEHWPDALVDLQNDGFSVVALTPSPHADDIAVVARDRPERMALLFGAEGPGLSQAALRVATRQIRIPMSSTVDSLNVATAAAIAFHRLTDVR